MAENIPQFATLTWSFRDGVVTVWDLGRVYVILIDKQSQ